MAKDGKKSKAAKKAKKAEGAAGTSASDVPSLKSAKKAKRKKGARAPIDALRSTLTRPATIVAAAGAAVVAGLTGLWRSRR